MGIQWEIMLNEIGTWSPDRQDEFQERAAIREFLAGNTRANAELLAFQELKRAERK